MSRPEVYTLRTSPPIYLNLPVIKMSASIAGRAPRVTIQMNPARPLIRPKPCQVARRFLFMKIHPSHITMLAMTLGETGQGRILHHHDQDEMTTCHFPVGTASNLGGWIWQTGKFAGLWRSADYPEIERIHPPHSPTSPIPGDSKRCLL